MERGFTLLELIVTLTLTTLALGVSLPAARRLNDRFAVVGAREAVVGLVSRARSRAVLQGGAAVMLYEEPSLIEVRVGGVALDSLDTQRAFGVQFDLSGSGSSATIAFDALGIGRLANRRILFRRGGETAGLVISAYGRVTRS